MECPYCKEEMNEGFIYSGKNDICWTPIDKKSNFIINHPNKDQILLAKLNFFKGCKIKVFRCNKCQVDIINEKDL